MMRGQYCDHPSQNDIPGLDICDQAMGQEEASIFGKRWRSKRVTCVPSRGPIAWVVPLNIHNEHAKGRPQDANIRRLLVPLHPSIAVTLSATKRFDSVKHIHRLLRFKELFIVRPAQIDSGQQRQLQMYYFQVLRSWWLVRVLVLLNSAATIN
ncbi:hypothetical protein TRIATDRAFT_89869 [Trichoderma atroviride IMI 206040]|uniref:Uncharacterized protein n=1 Tax=Hypocrea atroviridis (strain ATCC 20476 / IMI 206040) TaxID=452589 RepID=G9NSU6_HYPAI|nr:uncharacterized protein TRIATDRAFT_89869 [Trichoderma atroviride IMI 206040]EHK46491.1 hypothetical protein TRIATDRAFT_89869 [Trichoderma atroviride IMI 206040]